MLSGAMVDTITWNMIDSGGTILFTGDDLSDLYISNATGIYPVDFVASINGTS